MRAILRVAVCLLVFAGLARGQQSSPPALPTNLYTTLPSGSGSGSTFSFSAYGGVDDDVTDNCANGAVAAFTTAVNNYTGPGVPVAIIDARGAKQTYKLATNANSCTFAFTRASGVSVYMWANIDCAQTAQSCMQFGPSGVAVEVNSENYTLDGIGAFLDGSHLTLAGIYMEPGITGFNISHIRFGTSSGGGGLGFGASSSTLGNCTNYSIYVDAPIAGGWIDHVKDYVNSTGVTAGGCGMANPNGAATGSNTIYFESNFIGTSGAVGATQCGSIGIIDGGSLGMSSNNNIYGFGMPIRVQGIGHRLLGNQIDSAGCSAKGVSSIIHVGANGSAVSVGAIDVEDNVVQVVAGHTTNLLAIAGDSTATLNGVAIIGNQNTTGGGPGVGNLIPSNLGCTAINPTHWCHIDANIGFNVVLPAGATQAGWLVGMGIIGTVTPATQTANLGSTLLVTATNVRAYIVMCQVIETVAGSVSSTLPSCVVSYTSPITSTVVTQTISATNAGNTIGTTSSGVVFISASAGTAINISSTGYASSAAGMTYQLQAFASTY